MMRQFNAEKVIEAIEKERITVCFLVPSMVNFILQMPDIEKRDFSSLRQIIYGGAPMPVSLLKKAIKVFGCEEFINAYGAGTEAGLQTILRLEDHVTEGTEQ